MKLEGPSQLRVLYICPDGVVPLSEMRPTLTDSDPSTGQIYVLKEEEIVAKRSQRLLVVRKY